MVTEGTVTVEHAYTLSRLVDKGVQAAAVTEAAGARPEHAATKLGEIETAERREHRRRKLERAGIRVILVDRPHQADGQYDRHLSWMHLDGDHSAEPCHVVILHFNHYGRTTIGEDEACTDRTRHDADGSSLLKVRSARVETDTERQAREAQEERDAEHEATRQARHQQAQAEFTRMTERLAAAPDEAVIAAVLRTEARTLRAPTFEDTLLPVPEGVVDPDERWMFPAQVIDEAPLADLARALVRRWMLHLDRGYHYSHRENQPIVALAATLPDHAEAEVA
ncbi:MAG: hypothetical protein OXF41_21240 [bacterium]|nr:hypothetical protein [bacterium]